MLLGPIDWTAPFWKNIYPEPNSGCWLYAGWLDTDGYGVVSVKKRKLIAHRYAYTQLLGPLLGWMHLDHTCEIRCCVNPDHLDPVTTQENTRRSKERGRHTKKRATHCPDGHELTPENTYNHPHSGTRKRCRVCRRAEKRAYRERRKAKGLPHL
jgi:hypothetical protein